MSRKSSYAPTDTGNAERIAAQHAASLRYVPNLGWFSWDGQRWRRDEDGAVIRAAQTSARSILREAAKIKDRFEYQELVEWALTSESEPRLRGAVKLAAAQEKLIVRAEALDADPLLLNVANGTIDLRTGVLREHRREDLVTRLAPVTFDATAGCEVWARFLARVTGGDPELQVFLQRLAGYMLTGLTIEEIVAFIHGPGASGKTTWVEAIRGIMGDYAASTDAQTFMRSRNHGVRDDLARLAGVRLVISTEVDEGREIDASVLKLATGGDKIAARHLFKEYFEFAPKFKVCFVGNSRPRADARDTGLWRRILEVPFTEAIPEAERDPQLKQRLVSDPATQSAILAWAVRGCLAWQEHGLGVPERVRTATRSYRNEADPVERWLTDECEFGPNLRATTAGLHQSNRCWTSEHGYEPLSPRALAQALRDRGCMDQRTATTRYWLGIRLLNDAMTDRDAVSHKSPIRAGIGGSRNGRHSTSSRHPNPATTRQIPSPKEPGS